ncbi:hypothetical protein LINGRAHAP2_LOCUS27022 [Linum grandiflorum]
MGRQDHHRCLAESSTTLLRPKHNLLNFYLKEHFVHLFEKVCIYKYSQKHKEDELPQNEQQRAKILANLFLLLDYTSWKVAFSYSDSSISWTCARSSTRGHGTSTVCYSSCMNFSQERSQIRSPLLRLLYGFMYIFFLGSCI